MAESLQQFKSYAVNAGSVANPGVNTYVGECVSLIQQYLSRVFGIPFQARGHAKDWATNANVLSYFDRVNSPQAGDIGLSGATARNPYGHIWIYLSANQILEQNGRISRRVSTGTWYLSPIAILRRKGAPASGGQTMVDGNMLNNLYLTVFGRTPDAGAKGFIGKPADVVLQLLIDAPEETQFEKALRLEAKVNELNQKLASASAGDYVKITDIFVRKG